jgi:cytochrome oxidase assembly protein ShyY1
LNGKESSSTQVMRELVELERGVLLMEEEARDMTPEEEVSRVTVAALVRQSEARKRRRPADDRNIPQGPAHTIEIAPKCRRGAFVS